MALKQCNHCGKLFSKDHLVTITVYGETDVLRRFFVCKKCKKDHLDSYWGKWIKSSGGYLNCKLAPTIGWLAPDGRYYIPSNPDAEWRHYEIGVSIYRAFYSNEEIPDEFAMRDSLLGKGYICVDVTSIDFDFDKFKNPSCQQIDTLFNLYLNKGWQSPLTRIGIQRFLVRATSDFYFLGED